MKNIIYGAMTIVALIGLNVIIYVQAENNKQLIYDLNVSQTAFKIQSGNVKRLNQRIEELQTANGCLLKAMDKPTVTKAIKSTPLPKIITKETK